MAQDSIQIAVLNSEKTYNSGSSIIKKSITVTADKLDVSFPELTDREYAIMLLHDENV